jgi:hypothetical protein
MIELEVDYIFCIPGEVYSSNFLTSWTNSIISLLENSESFIYINHYTSSVSHTRNQMIRCSPFTKNLDPTNILPFENKIKSKKIIFIDDDMVWNYEDLEKIMKSNKDIVSGFCKTNFVNNKNQNFLSAIKNNEFLTEDDIKNKTELIEVDAVGFAFVAINFEVFQKIKFPWFEIFDIVDPKTKRVMNVGEDYNFCKKATAAGYRIYADPTIKVGHEKLKVLDFKND